MGAKASLKVSNLACAVWVSMAIPPRDLELFSNDHRLVNWERPGITYKEFKGRGRSGRHYNKPNAHWTVSWQLGLWVLRPRICCHCEIFTALFTPYFRGSGVVPTMIRLTLLCEEAFAHWQTCFAKTSDNPLPQSPPPASFPPHHTGRWMSADNDMSLVKDSHEAWPSPYSFRGDCKDTWQQGSKPTFLQHIWDSSDNYSDPQSGSASNNHVLVCPHFCAQTYCLWLHSHK